MGLSLCGSPTPLFISCSPHCSFPWCALLLDLPCFGMIHFYPASPGGNFWHPPLEMQCVFHFTLMMSHGLLFALMASRPVVFLAGCFVICFVICLPVGLEDDWPVGPDILMPVGLWPICLDVLVPIS